MIKYFKKLLFASLSLIFIIPLGCMEVQQQLNPVNQELLDAAKNGDVKTVEAALVAGADVNYVDNNGDTALTSAALRSHIAIVTVLLDAGANVNQADRLGNTALILAASRGYTNIVRLLLDHNANVNRVNTYGVTALILAAEHGRTEIVGMLMEHGATIPTGEQLLNISNLEYAKQVLHAVFEGNELAYAAALGNIKRLVELLSTLPQKTITENISTQVQAQPQSPQAQSLPAQFRKLLASYAILPPTIPSQPPQLLNLNRQDSHGMTALHWAAAQGHDNIVRLLFDYGANINIPNAEGNTPLHIVARNGNLSMVKLLLELGADATLVNRDGQTPLALARQYRHPDVAVFLKREVERAAFSKISREGFPWQPTGKPLPSYVAEQIAQFVLAPGSSPGSPELHWAAAQGNTAMVRSLLYRGADINAQDEEGNTPLHLAARNGSLSTAKLLLARGANPTIVNRDGQTPLALAYRYDRPTIVAFLEREAGGAIFRGLTRAGRRGQFEWQPAGQQQPLPPEIAEQIAQFALAPGHIPPAGSPS